MAVRALYKINHLGFGLACDLRVIFRPRAHQFCLSLPPSLPSFLLPLFSFLFPPTPLPPRVLRRTNFFSFLSLFYNLTSGVCGVCRVHNSGGRRVLEVIDIHPPHPNDRVDDKEGVDKEIEVAVFLDELETVEGK